MKQTRKFGDVNARQNELRKLALWLEEWRICRILRPVNLNDPAAPTGSADVKNNHAVSADAGNDPELKARPRLQSGQIRLLRPGQMDLPQERPVYVLLLKRQSHKSFLVAPFSRFANPAVPGEWQTGLRALPLRVLCLWNARRVAVPVLLEAWFCGSIEAVLVSQAVAIWRHLKEGTPVCAATMALLGPPLKHPMDPRRTYLEEERELLDAHPGIVGEAGGKCSLLRYGNPSSNLRMAAEERNKYGDQ